MTVCYLGCKGESWREIKIFSTNEGESLQNNLPIVMKIQPDIDFNSIRTGESQERTGLYEDEGQMRK